MTAFRKKPVVIEARQMTGSAAEVMTVCEWVVSKGYPWLLGDATRPETLAAAGSEPGGAGVYIDPGTGEFVIRTLEGDMRVTWGDWVIRGVHGEFYPCKPDIFAETYEPVGAQS